MTVSDTVQGLTEEAQEAKRQLQHLSQRVNLAAGPLVAASIQPHLDTILGIVDEVVAGGNLCAEMLMETERVNDRLREDLTEAQRALPAPARHAA